ncbi:hypothetical protein GF402_00380 [Candidatus Fermentibacteria bacterium]|nr:hypothetical protein [Candidatus Fermentibacteria bacterium]
MVDPSKLFEPVTDKCYRVIILVTGVYSIVLSVIPLARLVPRPPLQLLIWASVLLLYKLRFLPDQAKRWLFYVFLFVTYPALRHVVTTYPEAFHCLGILEFEQSLFGTLPSVWLQSILHPDSILRWYDYLFALLHVTLFSLPVVFSALMLWRRGPEVMKRASVAIVIVSLTGYLTYVLFPLTPPWMAGLEGLATEMDRVVFRAIRNLFPAGVVGAFQPSPRGAMPSLHAGLPLLLLIICLREFGGKVWWLSIPVVLVCFEIVYGAEHYVVDVVVGFVYALASYIVVYWLMLPGPARCRSSDGSEETPG